MIEYIEIENNGNDDKLRSDVKDKYRIKVYMYEYGVKYYNADYKDNNNSMNEAENKGDND